MQYDNPNMIINNSVQLFPRVVLLNIYYHLDIKDLYNCSLVNKHFNKLFDSDILWDKLLCDQCSPNLINNIKLNYDVSKPKILYKMISNLYTINKILSMNQTFDQLINTEIVQYQRMQLTRLPVEIKSWSSYNCYI